MLDRRIKYWNQQVFCEFVTVGRQMGADHDTFVHLVNAMEFMVRNNQAMSDNLNLGTKVLINGLHKNIKDQQPVQV